MANNENHDKLGQIVAKCWKDAAFKQRFLSDPKSVLAEHKIDMPAGVNFKVVENTDKQVYFTLPMPPPSGELSEAQLEKAAGGASLTLSIATTHQLVQRYTSNSATNTCGKSCIPW